jgi:hypothetical protein
LELSDIREFEEITQKLDAVKRAQGELQSLQAAYDRLLETSKQMENKYITISLENRILKQITSAEKQIEGKFSELETKLKLADEMAKAQIKDSSLKEQARSKQ